MVFKYLIKTPLAVIRHDFYEYRKLCRMENMLRDKYWDAYDALVVDFGEQNYDATVSGDGCIVKCVQVYSGGFDSNPDIRMCESRCANFNLNTPCCNHDCMYLPNNDLFFKSKQMYENIKNLRKQYWKTKFRGK